MLVLVTQQPTQEERGPPCPTVAEQHGGVITLLLHQADRRGWALPHAASCTEWSYTAHDAVDRAKRGVA